MQVGKEGLAGLQQGSLFRLGFLDLDDHVGCLEYRRSVFQNLGPGLHIIIVREADGSTSIRLNANTVAVATQLMDRRRCHSHPVLVILDLLRYAYLHA